MGKQLVVKVKYQDELRKISATDVKEERGRLVALFDSKKVADFNLDDVQQWSFEDTPDFIKPDSAAL